jgi:hypothetical protein
MKKVTIMASPPASKGLVHCPICTHTVGGEVITVKRSLRVKPGQRCAHCGSSLDAGYVIHYDKAA